MRHRSTLKLVTQLIFKIKLQKLKRVFAVASDMEVVDVPQSKPIITEIKSHYRIGDLVRGNCSSAYSRPVTNLTWLFNEMPVNWKNFHCLKLKEKKGQKKTFLCFRVLSLSFL